MKTPLPPGPPLRKTIKADVDTWASYVERIDVRSPGEFAEDHLPGAINLPVLDDAERARVGTMYVQQSAFDARKIGAAIVSRNIAAICDGYARDKPREWSPLVYCWRGGQRSRALVHVLTEIGFRACAARRRVSRVAAARRRHVAVPCAAPALSRHLRPDRLGQVAADRGARRRRRAGARPRASRTASRLAARRPAGRSAAVAEDVRKRALRRDVVVRRRRDRCSSNRRASGSAGCKSPNRCWSTMRESPCIRLDTSQALRVAMLEADYAHLVADHAQLHARLAPLASCMATRRSRAGLEWAQRAARRPSSTADLLDAHYDPLYERAIAAISRAIANAVVLRIDDATHATFRALARAAAGRIVTPAAARPLEGATDDRATHSASSTYSPNRRSRAIRSRVFEDARGLDDATMQALALQFNLSETTFVLPSTTRDGARARSSRRRSRCRSPAIRRSAPRTSCATLRDAGDR